VVRKRKRGRARPLSAAAFKAELDARLAAADRYDRRVAKNRYVGKTGRTKDELLEENAERFRKIADQVPVVDVKQWQAAIDKCAPSPPHWSGTGEAWLLGHGDDWPGAFIEYPLQQNEKVWAPKRHDDYCRRIMRKARAVGVLMKASTIKKWYLRRPNRAKPLK
jgi:hypothetical protein